MYTQRGVLDRPKMVPTSQITSIADLRAADPPQFVDYQEIAFVLGYNDANDEQGAIYYWDDRSTAADDDYTVIQPNNSLGPGRWRLFSIQDESDGISPEDFGAKGDGVTDDGPAFDLAVASGVTTINLSPKTYRIASGTCLAVTDRDLIIEGNSATILIDANINPIYAQYSFGTPQAATITTGVSKTFTGGAGSTLVTTLDVTNGADFSVNDIGKLFSDDLIAGADTADNERKGEFVGIGDITTNKLYCWSNIYGTYTTSPKFAKMNTTNRVVIRNLKFRRGTTHLANSSWSKAQIIISGAYRPVVENVESIDGNGILVEFRSCYQGGATNVRGSNQRTSSSDGAYAYVVIENSCQEMTHTGLQGYNVRHVYTTGCRPTSVGDNNVVDRGETRFSRIVNSVGQHCQAAPFDTHPDAEGIEFVGCTVMRGYNGPLGNQRGFSFRGRRNRAVDCMVIGSGGFTASSDFANANNSFGHVFQNCRYIATALDTSTARYPFSVEGQSGGVVDGVQFINCSVEQANGTNALPSMYFTYATGVRIVDPVIKHSATGTNSARVLQLDNGSTVVVSEGIVDISGSSGTGHILAQVRDSSSSIVWHNPRIIAGAVSWRALADFNSLNGSAKFSGVWWDLAPSVAALNVNGGGSQTFTAFLNDLTGVLTGSATYNPPSLADGAGATTTVTVTGAALGDYVEGVAFSLDLQGITVTAYVSAADTVSVRFQNESGGLLDLASGTLYVRVRRRM